MNIDLALVLKAYYMFVGIAVFAMIIMSRRSRTHKVTPLRNMSEFPVVTRKPNHGYLGAYEIGKEIANSGGAVIVAVEDMVPGLRTAPETAITIRGVNTLYAVWNKDRSKVLLTVHKKHQKYIW